MSTIKNSNKKNKDIPQNKKVDKPWGSEYSIYRNKISSAKLLKLNTNQKTSLHCHPTKKTGFILLDGKVDVEVGFYEKKKMKSISKLMIRPGLFHSTKNVYKKTATIIEIETPVDKDDLVRFKDDYGRENLPYEKKNKMTELNNQEIVFKDPKINSKNQYKIMGKKIVLEKTDNIKKIKNKNRGTIFAVLDGGLCGDNKQLVLSPGDIVNGDTIKKLSSVFKIKKYITFLSIKYER